MNEKTKCLIVGSGPAGYTAAIYTGRANLSPILYEGEQPGGQLTITTEVENFPGYPDGVDGFTMMEDLKKQALKFGVEVRNGIVTACDLSQKPYRVTVDGSTEIETDVLIIATGAVARYLGLPDEQKYAGKGVSACATCDGFFYRRKVVAVVGGGDSACEEAIYLAGIASKVYLIVRKNYLRASQILQNRVLNHPKIEVLFNANVVGLFGKEFIEGANVIYYMGESIEEKVDIAIDGLFLAIGRNPNSAVFKQYLPTDANGYIKTDWGTTRTHLPGIFVAGDVADPHYQQAVVAAASGCIAAMEAEKYLNVMGS